jgi:hypothetical protein
MLDDMKRELEQCYDRAIDLASEIVEKMARKILRKDKSLHFFCMSMGLAIFVTKDDKNLGLDEKKAFKELNAFVDDWDEYLKVTGEPMAFTADGPKVTEWTTDLREKLKS